MKGTYDPKSQPSYVRRDGSLPVKKPYPTVKGFEEWKKRKEAEK